MMQGLDPKESPSPSSLFKRYPGVFSRSYYFNIATTRLTSNSQGTSSLTNTVDFTELVASPSADSDSDDEGGVLLTPSLKMSNAKPTPPAPSVEDVPDESAIHPIVKSEDAVEVLLETKGSPEAVERAKKAMEAAMANVTLGNSGENNTTTGNKRAHRQLKEGEHWLDMHGPAMDSDKAFATYEMYEVRPSPGKGFGCFAIKQIPKGTRIQVETPFSSVRGMNEEDMDTEWEKLSNDQIADLFALHSHRGDDFRTLKARYFSLYEQNGKVDPDMSSDVRANFWCVFATNSFSGPNFDYICLQASRFNHSCVPNAFAGFNSIIKQHTTHAMTDIAAGEEILISYYNHEGMSREARQQALDKYGFKCDCAACKPQTEFGKKSDVRRKVFAALQNQYQALHQGAYQTVTDEKSAGVMKGMIKMLEDEGLFNPKLADCYYGLGVNTGNARSKVLGDNPDAVDNFTKALALLRICAGTDSEDYQRVEKEMQAGWNVMKSPWAGEVLKREEAAKGGMYS